jgi:HEPN domain-containing protein
MLVVPADVSPRDAEIAARNAIRSHGIWTEVFALSDAEYARQQQDPGLLAFRFAREGRVLFSRGTVPQRVPVPANVREKPSREGLERWIKRAESDFRTANSSALSDDPVWDAIVFHSHACVEKLLKALIVRSGTYPPRTHDLTELLATQPPVIRDSAAAVRACRLLHDLWPRSRYPESAEPTPEEARMALEAARQVRDLVHPLLATPGPSS